MGGSSAAPEHSASTIAAEEVTGSHVLTVDGYTRTKKGLVAGQFFRSAAFAAGGHRWSISYYPVGTNEDDAREVAVKAFVSWSLLDRRHRRDGAVLHPHGLHGTNDHLCGIVFVAGEGLSQVHQ